MFTIKWLFCPTFSYLSIYMSCAFYIEVHFSPPPMPFRQSDKFSFIPMVNFFQQEQRKSSRKKNLPFWILLSLNFLLIDDVIDEKWGKRDDTKANGYLLCHCTNLSLSPCLFVLFNLINCWAMAPSLYLRFKFRRDSKL